MDIGAVLGAILTTQNALGAFNGPNHAEEYVSRANRNACIEYAIENGQRDVQGALWQCGAFGANGVAVASDFKSTIIRLENALRGK